MSNDPWKHKSEGMCCSSCMWNVSKTPIDGTTVAKLGRCRKHAPTMNGYPAVFRDDWCGDHKLDENKLKAKKDKDDGPKYHIRWSYPNPQGYILRERSSCVAQP